MSTPTSKLPRIMYDQTQYTAVYWIDKNGLWLNEEGYKNMETISSYAPEGWITYTQNTPQSFWFGAYEESALEEEATVGFKNFSDPAFLKKFEEAVKESYEKTTALKEKYFGEFYGREKQVVAETPEKTVQFLEEIKKVNTFILSYYFLTQPQRFYTFEKELKNEGLDKETELISTNGRTLTYVTELRKTVLDYVEGAIDYPKLLDVVNRFGFLNWGLLGGDLIDEQYIDKEIKILKSDTPKFNEEKKKMDELVSSIEKRNAHMKGNPSRAYMLADVMGHSSVLRFDLQTCILCILKYADNLLKEVATHNSLTEDELKSYEFIEVLALIQQGTKISPELITQRQKGFLRVYTQIETKTFLGEDAHKEIKELLEFRKNEIHQTKSLKGTVASWPDKEIEIITGKAFVLTTAFGADDLVKAMKEGEILVATQTHPNLVPKMKEALAIITDEGGITCHAAIVSRELAKPCIIGTRLATKVIKIGDTITLNLKTGEINIIKP